MVDVPRGLQTRTFEFKSGLIRLVVNLASYLYAEYGDGLRSPLRALTYDRSLGLRYGEAKRRAHNYDHAHQLPELLRQTQDDSGIVSVQDALQRLLQGWLSVGWSLPPPRPRSLPEFLCIYYYISPMADGPQRARLPIPPTKRCHLVCGNEGSSHLSPVLNSRFFIALQFSTLTTRQPMVEFTYSCSHAFRYGRRNKNSALSRIELTTSSLVSMRGYPLDYLGDEVHQSVHDVFVRLETRVGYVYKQRGK